MTAGKNGPSGRRRSRFRKVIQQSIQKRNLSLLQLEARVFNRKEAHFVDLGKGLELAGTDRPLGAEGIAGVIVPLGRLALAGPGVDDLAAFLPDRAEFDERPRGSEANFFGELALCGEEEVFVRVGFAFGDGPMAIVLAREERAAGMREEDFRRAVAEAEQEEAGGDTG